ncbi:hypothetical protein niasHT_035301 [Heterodera trifolii]|uniref:Galectin domain-containing protein n=1 Tax=Heterodera trifolii TaxID=157864 RepID=A0ABD2I5A1_9BILA
MMCFCALSLFFVSLHFHSIFDQFASKHVLLTGKAHEVKKRIEFNSPDQCMPYIQQGNPSAEHKDIDDAKTFGFSFRLPKFGGNCDDGLIICYPGTLDNITAGNWPNLVAFGRFRVGNDENETNEATHFCAEKWQTDGKGKGLAWHGIYIRTKRIDGENELKNRNKRTVTMKMSISPKEYDFGHIKQFSLHFGSRADPFTFVTFDDGINFTNKSEDSLPSIFLRTVPMGAVLRDFVGLWMLGMDILPFSHLHDVELFTYRGCNCTMDAWFTKPTDSEEPSMNDFHISAGTNKCNYSIEQQSFSIEPVEKYHSKDFAIPIIAITDENFSEIDVKLTDATHRSLMEFQMGTNQSLNVTFPNLPPYDQSFATLPNGSFTMILWVALRKNSYEIMLNDTALDNRQFWPKAWWNGSRRENVRHVVLSGQMLLLEEPTTVQIDLMNPVKLNYSKFYQQICIGTEFLFRVQLLENNAKNCKNENNFAISLLHNRPEQHIRVGSTLLEMKVNPCRKQNQFTFTNQHFGKKTSLHKNFIFNVDKQREYEFKLIFSNTYKFFVNGILFYEQNTSITPAWAINFVRVEGNVNLLEEPSVDFTNCESEDGISMELYSLLNYGELVKIEGRVDRNATVIKIYLFHEVAQFTEMMGDVLLRLVFNFKDNTIKCSHWLYAEKEWKDGDNTQFRDLRLYKGQIIILKILMADDGFYGSISDTNYRKFCNYYTTINQSISNMSFPPFAIDYVRVDGNFSTEKELTPIQIIAYDNSTHYLDDKNTTINCTPLPFKQINRTDGLLKVNESIIVVMALKGFNPGEKQEVGVFFFNQAIGYHDLIGKNVLKIILDNENISLSSTYPKQWMIDVQEDNRTMHGALRANTVLNFTITVKGISDFELILSRKDKKDAEEKALLKHLFKQKIVSEQKQPLPAWATQYVTITYKGMATPKAQVFCVPENRCTKKNGEMAYEYVFNKANSTN